MTLLSTIFRRASDVRYRILNDEAVVIRQRAGEVLGLNSLGARLLDSVDGRRRTEEIIATLLPDYDVDRETFTSDSLAFFEAMSSSGVIEEVPEGKAT